jgi:trans-2,3-dihydro-3-hydroxyanthranilate isomerase
VAHRFQIVDVFAESRYAGNTLAVVLDAADLDTATMQAIAREFGFSETTFVVSDPGAADPGGVRVRIFTPQVELPFAGHPTLGTASVIRELRTPRPRDVALALGVGRVPVAFEPEPGGEEVAWLTAPPVRLAERLDAARVAPCLGLATADLDAALPIRRAEAGPAFVFVPLRRRADLARVRVDLDGLARDTGLGATTGVYLFSREAVPGASPVRARMFFEAAGLREDPATGSATACFGAYLLAHGGYGAQLRLRIEQGVEMGRPSLLRLEASGPVEAARIRVGGRVIESARGELT